MKKSTKRKIADFFSKETDGSKNKFINIIDIDPKKYQ